MQAAVFGLLQELQNIVKLLTAGDVRCYLLISSQHGQRTRGSSLSSLVLGEAKRTKNLDLKVALAFCELLEDLGCHGEVAHGFDTGSLHHLVFFEQQVSTSTPAVGLHCSGPHLFADSEQVREAHGRFKLEELVVVR